MKNAEMEIVKFGNEDVIATSDFILTVSGAGTDNLSFIVDGHSFTGSDKPEVIRNFLQSKYNISFPTLNLYDIGFDTVNQNAKLDTGEFYYQYDVGFKKIGNNNYVYDTTASELATLNRDWIYVGNDGHSPGHASTWIALMFKPYNPN